MSNEFVTVKREVLRRLLVAVMPEIVADGVIAEISALEQPEVEQTVQPRHPVVVHWRNNGIEACAGIAEAYGNADAARDMRALLTKAPQPAQHEVEPVAELSDDKIMASIGRWAGQADTSVSDSRPLGKQWGQICALFRHIARERYGVAPKPVQQPFPEAGAEALLNENRVLRESLERCKKVGSATESCWDDDKKEAEALLRQALEALSGVTDMTDKKLVPKAITAIRKYLGEA